MSPSRSRQSFFGRLFGLFLIALGALILLIIPAWLSRPTPAIANPTGMATFKNRYPGIAGSKLDSCTTCHTAAIPATNPFGAAYLANGRNDGALATMEPTGHGWGWLDKPAGDPESHLPRATARTTPPAARPPTPRPPPAPRRIHRRPPPPDLHAHHHRHAHRYRPTPTRHHHRTNILRRNTSTSRAPPNADANGNPHRDARPSRQRRNRDARHADRCSIAWPDQHESADAHRDRLPAVGIRP